MPIGGLTVCSLTKHLQTLRPLSWILLVSLLRYFIRSHMHAMWRCNVTQHQRTLHDFENMARLWYQSSYWVSKRQIKMILQWSTFSKLARTTLLKSNNTVRYFCLMLNSHQGESTEQRLSFRKQFFPFKEMLFLRTIFRDFFYYWKERPSLFECNEALPLYDVFFE